MVRMKSVLLQEEKGAENENRKLKSRTSIQV